MLEIQTQLEIVSRCPLRHPVLSYMVPWSPIQTIQYLKTNKCKTQTPFQPFHLYCYRYENIYERILRAGNWKLETSRRITKTWISENLHQHVYERGKKKSHLLKKNQEKDSRTLSTSFSIKSN